ncbi:MAG: NAD(P)H-dependent glycerol-3-phosphate dehydrogenase [Pseudomonadales bacterium]|jgi:glycerol-3-phosphate dehydrogenase (NAD(P)+)
MNNSQVAVLGGGSFGTTLANILAENGHRVWLWLRDELRAAEINETRVNQRYMPDYPLHENLTATTDLVEAVTGSELVLVSLPSSAFVGIVQSMAPHLNPEQMLVSTTKGVVADGFKLMSEVLKAETCCQQVGVLSGPNLAKEIGKHMPTATVIASDSVELRQRVQALLANDYFRVYASNDTFGVELGGALKNIYAIISGLAAALGMGENTRSMLITRSLAEMSRFAVCMGANPMTFIGLAGVGDLVATCMSPLSRNYRVGYALGKGGNLEQVVAELGEVAEGVNTLKLVKHRADEMGVYMPLVNGLYQVIFNQLPIPEVVAGLMKSDQSSDVEFILPREET